MSTASYFIPIRCSNSITRWSLSELEKFEAASRGEPEPPHRGADVFLDVRQVAARYIVSVPSVWRWAREARKAQVERARGEETAA